MGFRPDWTSSSWRDYSYKHSVKSATKVDDVIKTDDFDPLYVPKIFLDKKGDRESRDSELHPESTPIAVFLDVTGSMDDIIVNCFKKLGILAGDVFNKNVVKDPQIMFGAVDDSYSTDTPVQATEFENDIAIAEQLSRLNYVGLGGGNGKESYELAWYLMSRHTKTDAFEKRGKKGLFNC